MNLKIKECPCCKKLNFIWFLKEPPVIENNFRSFAGWSLIKTFNCRSCKEQIGIFREKSQNLQKFAWLSEVRCEDNYVDDLRILREKQSSLSSNIDSEYYKVLNKIFYINNKIKSEKNKLKIKLKIEKKVFLN